VPPLNLKTSTAEPPRPAGEQAKEVFEMAASIFIEQESGTYTTFRHPHNGYYAGDFSGTSRSGSELHAPQPGRRGGSRTGTPLPSS
jgi:hypothetical protein